MMKRLSALLVAVGLLCAAAPTAQPPQTGGTGAATAPTVGQILIGQSNGNYAPETVSGGCTLSSTGVLTCSGGGSLTTTDGLSHTVTNTTSMAFGNGFVLSGSGGAAVVNAAVSDNSHATSYTVAAGDMNNAINLTATTGTPALTLPAVSTTIFAVGMSLPVTVTGTVPWTVTNSTGLTLAGVPTTLYPGMSGAFVPNADGTHLDWFGPPAGGTPTVTIAKGTFTLGTSAIASGACAAAVTVSASGVLTTDVVNASFNGNPTAVTGYIPSTAGMLAAIFFPTANNVNALICNNTAASITPGAITLNWQVTR